MNEKDRDRDNTTGRYVSDVEADARPESTTSESVKVDPLRRIFKRLHKEKGAIQCERATEQGVEFEAYGATFFYEPAAKGGEDTAGYDG